VELNQELLASREQVQVQALTDALTGIMNRRAILQVLGHEMARAGRPGDTLAVGMMDIGLFKRVNDTYGHAAGDQTLKAVADYCQKNLRGTDVLGRYGGEEFVVLLPETASAAAQEAAERIRRGIERLSVVVPDHTVTITASLGVVTFDSTHPTLDKLLDCADQALYQAKATGRNCFCVWSEGLAGA